MRVHLFIDADNIPASTAIAIYNRIQETAEVIGCECVGASPHAEYITLECDRRFRYYRCNTSKNSADLWLTALACSAIKEEKSFLDEVCIISNDRDFLPVAWISEQNGVRAKFCCNGHESKSLQKDINRLGLSNTSISQKDINRLGLPNTSISHRDINLSYGGRAAVIPFSNGMHSVHFWTSLSEKGFSKSERRNIRKEGILSDLGIKEIDNKMYFAA